MKIELWTTASCPFCMRARALLDGKGVDYEDHVLGPWSPELGEAKKKWGHFTVPIVVIDGELVGGSDELAALDAAGKLG
jgi:glutaredoxin 3